MKNKITYYRKLENMSVIELAEKVGVTRQHIHLIQKEDRIPNLELGLKISAVFNVDPYEMFGIDKE